MSKTFGLVAKQIPTEKRQQKQNTFNTTYLPIKINQWIEANHV